MTQAPAPLRRVTPMTLMVACLVPLASAAMVGAGCGGPCEKIAAFEAECGKGKGMPEQARRRVVASCESELSDGEPRRAIVDRVACVEGAAECSAYQSCLDDRRISRRVEEIRKNIAAGEPRDGVMHCDTLQDRIPDHDELKAACIEAASAALDADAKRNASFRIADTCREGWVKRDKTLASKCAEAFKVALQTAIKEGKYYDLKSDCAGDFASKNDSAKAVCKEVLGAARTDLVTNITDVRDGKVGPDRLWTKCSNLKTVGEAMGGNHKRDAERLCKEAEAGADMKEAREKVEDELKKERKNLPLACASAMKRVQELVPSPWQKQARSKLVKDCYETLAVKMLEEQLPTMKECSYQAKKVLEATDRYKISHPKLDPLVAKARTKCKQ